MPLLLSAATPRHTNPHFAVCTPIPHSSLSTIRTSLSVSYHFLSPFALSCRDTSQLTPQPALLTSSTSSRTMLLLVPPSLALPLHSMQRSQTRTLKPSSLLRVALTLASPTMPRTPGACANTTSPFSLSPLTRWRACTIFLPAQRCPTCGDWSTAEHESGTCRAPDADLTDYSGGSTSDDEAVTAYARALRSMPTNPSYAKHLSSSSTRSRSSRTRHRQCRRRPPSSTPHSPAPRLPTPSLSSSTSNTSSSPTHTCPLAHLQTPPRNPPPPNTRKPYDPLGDQADEALRIYGYPISRYDMRTGIADRLSPDRGGPLEPNCWCLWGVHAHKNHRPIISLLTARARDGPIKSGGWDVLYGRGYGYRAFPGPEGESRPVWTQHIVFLLGGHGPRLQLNRACAREAEARGLLPFWPVPSTKPSSATESDSSIESIPRSHLPRILQKHTARLALSHTGTSRQAERAERGAWIVSDTFTAPGLRNTCHTRPHDEFWQRNYTTDYMEHGVLLPTSPNRFYDPCTRRHTRHHSSTSSSDTDDSDDEDNTVPITPDASYIPPDETCKHSQPDTESHTSTTPETETTRL
ncbi:protein TRL1 [Cynomolgus macaque cytomegalovirus strain Ottawa]|uniref:Protein TRL1 n=1 Tax=macacine betaherpesvirus 8 TaxID=2560567 RepID=G8H104_9BETA|nr:protein TRL1 [Cynomolgus macaque cytomegalovirus strain Ottawa]AEQ32078.1 protein TRL1 [Cynomolgus macaque cytomegalovirus strain Ottawa]